MNRLLQETAPGGPTHEVREKASRELKRLRDTVAGALRKTKKGAPLEQVLRIDRLLDRLDVPISSTSQLRAIRAVAALEQIGGPKARKILETLAAGADGAALTEEAKSSLRRLKTTGR